MVVGGDWNMTDIFFHILEMIIPIDYFFGWVETTNQLWWLNGGKIAIYSGKIYGKITIYSGSIAINIGKMVNDG